jgi:uncharacterized protein (TIGR00375 family)
MRIIADLHIHSKYSRATSKQMEPTTLALWARKKGINLIATGDFTHPRYLSELKSALIEDGSGFLEVKKSTSPVTSSPVTQSPGRPASETKFVLSGEISCIYKDKEKTRRIHILILIPDFETADKIIATLEKYKCNLKSDGRPIIGLSAKKLAEICFAANEKTLVIPAHVWTPWFAVFGSKSGYDSLEECFEELTPKIFAIETGLSSDPAMNWRLSSLDNISLISNSDAHSPANLGREANVFDFKHFSYEELYETLKNKDKKKFLYTIEFFPEEGKYHYDGHATCKFVCSPSESVKMKNICPVCKKELVLGVDHRVVALADRVVGFIPENKISYKSLVPLQEIIAECLQRKRGGKGGNAYYETMIERGENEFNILLNLSREEIKTISDERIAEAIMRIRDRKVIPQPGYDGIYGIIRVFTEEEKKTMQPMQSKLF